MMLHWSVPQAKGKLTMSEQISQPQKALKYEVEVREHGRVELTVPFAPGSRIVLFVIEETDDPFNDLVAASESSLGFWDNPIDDEECRFTRG
jgi:hypothetical protein